jgi:conserved hypothetical protein TIGR00051
MVRSWITYRILYAEVDRMGFVYYGNYARYYEMGRAELIRSSGYSYAEMERNGVVMPVIKLQCKYLKPARYDDVIRIETLIKELLPRPFITFHHRIFNPEEELIHTAEVTLTFFDLKLQKRVTMPDQLREFLLTSFT